VIKMTTKEIDNLEAGSKMNALVAEKVMGCKVEYKHKGAPEEPSCGCNERRPHNQLWNELSDDLLADYSTSISAAWEVLEKFRGNGKEWELVIGLNNYTISNMDCEGQFLPGWTYNDGIILVDAPTAPLAICRAALKAA